MYVLGELSPTSSTTVPGSHRALSRSVDGEKTPHGTPNPVGIDGPDVYWRRYPVAPTVIVMDALLIFSGDVGAPSDGDPLRRRLGEEWYDVACEAPEAFAT